MAATRRALVAGQDKLDPEAREKAWEMLYTAEGSDWFWWFGEGHSGAHDHLFDAAFRVYLQEVYKLLGQEIPAELLTPLENQVRGHGAAGVSSVIGTMQQSKEGY